MSYINFQPKDFFNTVLYTGSGSAQDLTVGFQPDLVWFKNRSYADHHNLVDRVRWVSNTNSAHLSPNQNNAEGTKDIINSFSSTGFNLETGDRGHNSSNGDTYCCWNWKAGTTSGLSGGTITPTAYSFSTTAGISIIKYTGNSTQGATLPHGLGVAPKMIWIKSTTNAEAWVVGHDDINPGNSWDYYLHLHDTSTAGQNNNRFGNVYPTTSVFTLGNEDQVNSSSKSYIAYVFAPIKGYSAMGAYTGTGSADGAYVYTGFKPAFVLIKSSSTAMYWHIFDSKRLGYNPYNYRLNPNATDTETTTTNHVDLMSNGFKIRTDQQQFGTNGANYIWMAFAAEPLVSSNDIPATAV